MRILIISFFLLLPVLDAPAAISLDVFLDDNSNVVFRIHNYSTNTIRLPSAGYTPLAEYTPNNTNPAYAIVRQPTVTAGIWLSDALELGTNGRIPSLGTWLSSLKIKTLKPGETLNIVCDPTRAWKDLNLTETNVVFRFEFNIPREYGRDYHLWSGDLSAAGPIEKFDSQTEIPAGFGGFCNVAQMLVVYDQLTDAEVTMQAGLNTNETSIKIPSYPGMTRAKAIAYIEKILHDQAGLVFQHKGNHVEISVPDAEKH